MSRVVDTIEFSIELERQDDDRIKVGMEDLGAKQLFVWEGDELTVNFEVVITEDDDDSDDGGDYRIDGDLR